MKWPDMISTIAKHYGVYYSDEEIEALSFEQKSNWLSANPVTAASKHIIPRVFEVHS